MKNVNLVEAVFSKNYHFESSILCTYGLNLNFFENYLMKLNALYSCEDICVFTDHSTYNSFISESYTPRWLNKRYLVNRLKTNGVFHPKLYMFASEKKALVGIGSANLTRDGVASNLEVFSVFEISETKTTYSYLLRDCINYVRRLANITKSESAINQIDTFNQLCRAYIHSSEDEENEISLIHNLDRPLIKTITDHLKNFKISKIQILSPFFDSKLSPLKVLLEQFPDCAVEIYLQQKKSNFPIDYFSDLKVDVPLFLYSDVKRYMHGKAILFHCDDRIILYSGSANFTRSALNKMPSTGNYEIGLIGQIDSKLSKYLTHPNGKNAVAVTNVEDVIVTNDTEFEVGKNVIEYIIEAIFKKNIITLTVNKEIPEKIFIPRRIKLLDFDGNEYEQAVNNDFSLEITSTIRKKVPGKLAVQLIGDNQDDNTVESNISWVVELEEKSGDPSRKRLRKIYNDPFELIEVLSEIMKTGTEEELKLFLLQFDIPLDLILPPRNNKKMSFIGSKGNIEGEIPNRPNHFFNATMLEVYIACLNRLYSKLEHHAATPQVNKINNFLMILSSLYSLIWFIGSQSLYDKFKDIKTINPNEWALIRNYYDILILYIDKSWELTWSKGGYSDAINSKLVKDQIDEFEENLQIFEEYIGEEYNYAFAQLTDFVLNIIDNFERLKKNLLVKTVQGIEVKPKIFPSSNRHIQPDALEQTQKKIQDTIDRLKFLSTDE